MNKLDRMIESTTVENEREAANTRAWCLAPVHTPASACRQTRGSGSARPPPSPGAVGRTTACGSANRCFYWFIVSLLFCYFVGRTERWISAGSELRTSWILNRFSFDVSRIKQESIRKQVKHRNIQKTMWKGMSNGPAATCGPVTCEPLAVCWSWPRADSWWSRSLKQ